MQLSKRTEQPAPSPLDCDEATNVIYLSCKGCDWGERRTFSAFPLRNTRIMWSRNKGPSIVPVEPVPIQGSSHSFHVAKLHRLVRVVAPACMLHAASSHLAFTAWGNHCSCHTKHESFVNRRFTFPLKYLQARVDCILH